MRPSARQRLAPQSSPPSAARRGTARVACFSSWAECATRWSSVDAWCSKKERRLVAASERRRDRQRAPACHIADARQQPKIRTSDAPFVGQARTTLDSAYEWQAVHQSALRQVPWWRQRPHVGELFPGKVRRTRGKSLPSSLRCTALAPRRGWRWCFDGCRSVFRRRCPSVAPSPTNGDVRSAIAKDFPAGKVAAARRLPSGVHQVNVGVRGDGDAASALSGTAATPSACQAAASERGRDEGRWRCLPEHRPRDGRYPR